MITDVAEAENETSFEIFDSFDGIDMKKNTQNHSLFTVIFSPTHFLPQKPLKTKDSVSNHIALGGNIHRLLHEAEVTQICLLFDRSR